MGDLIDSVEEQIEEIEIAQATKGEKYSGSFPAIIELVEVRGAKVDLTLQTGAHRLVCRTGRGIGHLTAGHRAQFQLNLRKLCLFDPVSTRRIVQEA